MSKIINISNSLSCLRGFLAFFFLYESVTIRLSVIFFSMLTDVIDGYLARRFQQVTKTGIILDPLMDKFFVIFCLSSLISENRLNIVEFCIIISRDFVLCIFGFYLKITNAWKAYKIQSIICGKVITSMQFIILAFLTLKTPAPMYIYAIFILFIPFTILELYQKKTKLHQTVP